jgi:hypothetical protein
MARRNRRRRQSNAWFVSGDAETVRQFSLHRMIETLSAHQLEALQSVADLRELELEMQTLLALLGRDGDREQAMEMIQNWLHDPAATNPEQVPRLKRVVSAEANSVATPPRSQPPRRG